MTCNVSKALNSNQKTGALLRPSLLQVISKNTFSSLRALRHGERKTNRQRTAFQSRKMIPLNLEDRVPQVLPLKGHLPKDPKDPRDVLHWMEAQIYPNL